MNSTYEIDAANKKLETVARLIAGENLSIRHDRKATTAYIDLLNRTMTLPVWKEMSGPLYDLLVSHECSHAKHTPTMGGHETGHPKGQKYRMFLNIVEDARIERLIKEEYPGLKRIHSQGYQELAKRDFFRLKGKDINKLMFIDRLNIRCKLGSLVSIDFTSVEKYLLKKVDDAKTFNDVLYVTKLIWGYCKEEAAKKKAEEQKAAKEKQEKKESKPKPKDIAENGDGDESKGENADAETSEGEEQDGESKPSDNGEESEGQESGKKEPSDSEEAQPDFSFDEDEDENGDVPESESAGANCAKNGNDEGGEEGDDGEAIATRNSDGEGSLEKRLSDAADEPSNPEEDPTSETEEAFRENERSLVDNSSGSSTAICPVPEVDLKKFVVPCEKLLPIIKQNFLNRSHFIESSAKVKQFLRTESKTITQLITEFELRKNASQYARVRESKSGRIDIKKLSKYRFTDNVFASMMKVEEGKNHAMVLIFDQSVSIVTEYGNMLEQMIVLAEFCRRLNIPFEVYGFCNLHESRNAYFGQNEPDTTVKFLGTHGSITTADCHMKQYLRSDMSPALYQQGLQTMWALKDRYLRPRCEQLNGTPLNQAILLAGQIAVDLRARTRVDVMNIVVLTDGEAGDGNFDAIAGYNYGPTRTNYSWRGAISDSTLKSQTEKLADVVKRGADCNIVSLYITSQSYTALAVCKKMAPMSKGSWFSTPQQTKEAVTDLRTNGFYVTKQHGWTGYFVMAPRADTTITPPTQVQDARAMKNTTAIAATFSKSVVAARGNRRFLTVFAELITQKV